MTNSKATKKALFMSAISLMLCFTMLMGATFAWFTDTVQSTGNRIQAGTLQVDLVMDKPDADGDYDGNYLSIAEPENERARGDIFSEATGNGINWEPGKTEIVYLGVRNNGSLALKYNILLNVVDGDPGLIGSLEYAILDGKTSEDTYANWEEVKAAADGQVGDVKAGQTVAAQGGVLDEIAYDASNTEETDYFALAIHMKEEAGNEYQNGSITIDVIVNATQKDAEEDSFGPDYDSLAEYMNKNADGAWEINNLGNLVYFAQQVNSGNSYSGETIVLADDIDLKGINWAPIGTFDNAFSGTFDGKGYTISNLYINNSALEGVGLFGVAENATIKGINVENVDILGYSQVATIVGTPYSGCTISDCHVTGDISLVADWAYVGGICAYGYVDIDNCSVIADGTGVITSNERNAVGGICAWLLENGNSITNCTVKNLNLTGWANVGSIAGFVHYNNVVDTCSAKNINLVKTRVDGNPSIGALFGGWCYGANATVTVSNNTVTDVTMSGTAVAYDFAQSAVYGSEYYGKTTANFVESNNSYDYVNNITVISVAKDAASLSSALAAGGNIVLTADIDVAGTTFTVPAGKTAVLAMNGKTISGTFNNTSNANKNLFDIKGNLTVDGEGLITMDTTGINMGWNAMSCVLCVNGGDLTVNDTTIVNNGGTDMAYAIDTNPWNSANNKVLDVTLNNVKVESTYRGIRVRDNGPYLVKLVATDSVIDEIWYQEYSSGDNVNKGNYGLLVEVELNNTTCDTSRVNPDVLTIN